jgi:hypothetical protein
MIFRERLSAKAMAYRRTSPLVMDENRRASRYILCERLQGRLGSRGLWMCGRFTVKATWAELVALYRLTMEAPPHNLRPRFNVCPTDPVDVVTAEEGKRELVRCVGD